MINSPFRPRLACAALASVLLLAVSAAPAAEEPTAKRAPSIERIVSLPNLAGTAPAAPARSPDSRRVAFLWNDGGMPFRDLWVANSNGGGLERLTDLAGRIDDARPPEDDASLEALAARAAAREHGGISGFVWGPGGERIYFVFRGRIHVLPAGGVTPEVLAGAGPGASRLAFSPDGKTLSYLAGGDLWLLDPETGQTRQATDDGEPAIGSVNIGAYVNPDVEYRRYRWSADSRHIALEFVDRREVRRMPVPSYLHDDPILHEVRRPYPGDTDEIRRMALFDVERGELEFLELPDPTRRIFMDFEWSPVAGELLIMQGADVAEDRWILVASAGDGGLREVWHDHRPRRIYPAFRAVWSSDGERIHYIGDTDGHYHLYSLPAAGGEPVMLSAGEFDVAGSRGAAFLEVAAGRGELIFNSSEHSPYERHIYRMAESGGERVRITRVPGIHEPVLSPDGRRLALISSNDTTPPELYVMETHGDGPEIRVTESPLPEFYEYEWITPRYVSFDSRIDDFTLHARIIEPPGLDESKKYPVIFGNLYSNTARNAWNADRPTSFLQQQMALAGEYINVQVDVRGSIGYGVDFREAFQGDWGGDDLEDLHSAVKYLAGLPYVDTERICVWGNSYGGLLVLAALFKKPGLFAAGVAGAPAVDIRHFTGFDQHLTRRPDTHPEIFERGSLLDHGEKLEDPLLIIHGMHDDIVPFKTTLMMIEKLQLLGKNFDLAVVHNSGHWWAASEPYAIFTFGKLYEFFRRHVPPGAVAAPGGQ